MEFFPSLSVPLGRQKKKVFFFRLLSRKRPGDIGAVGSFFFFFLAGFLSNPKNSAESPHCRRLPKLTVNSMRRSLNPAQQPVLFSFDLSRSCGYQGWVLSFGTSDNIASNVRRRRRRRKQPPFSFRSMCSRLVIKLVVVTFWTSFGFFFFFEKPLRMS